jgi:hypothetical protein
VRGLAESNSLPFYQRELCALNHNSSESQQKVVSTSQNSLRDWRRAECAKIVETIKISNKSIIDADVTANTNVVDDVANATPSADATATTVTIAVSGCDDTTGNSGASSSSSSSIKNRSIQQDSKTAPSQPSKLSQSSSSSSSSSSGAAGVRVYVATAHHHDDQLETIAMKLLRGVHIAHIESVG